MIKEKAKFTADENRRDSYDRASLQYDNKRFTKAVEDASNEVLKDLLNLDPNSKILDLAAGTGRTAIPLAEIGFNVTALDLTDGMMNVMKKKILEKNIKNIEVVSGNAKQIPYEDSSFDAVVSFRFLHLFDDVDKQKIIDEAHRVVKPNGKVLLEFNNDGMIGRSFLGVYNWIRGKGLTSAVSKKNILKLYQNHRIDKIQGFGLPLTGSISKISPFISSSLIKLSTIKIFQSINRMAWVISNKK